MRQDIWPAIWENNAAQQNWIIHHTILVFLSAADSSNCVSLIKIHSLGKGGGGGDRLCFCLWVCRTSAHDNNNNISFHFLSWKNVTFWIFKRGVSLLLVCKWTHCGCIWRPLVTSMYWERRRKAVAGRSRSERGSAARWEWVVYTRCAVTAPVLVDNKKNAVCNLLHDTLQQQVVIF